MQEVFHRLISARSALLCPDAHLLEYTIAIPSPPNPSVAVVGTSKHPQRVRWVEDAIQFNSIQIPVFFLE